MPIRKIHVVTRFGTDLAYADKKQNFGGELIWTIVSLFLLVVGSVIEIEKGAVWFFVAAGLFAIAQAITSLKK